MRESLVAPLPASEFFSERTPAPIPEQAAVPVFEEELDVPAYLRQAKLLN
jgi:hypothetical protein